MLNSLTKPNYCIMLWLYWFLFLVFLACLPGPSALPGLLDRARVQSQAWQILARRGLTRVHLAHTRPEGGGGVEDLAWGMHRLKKDYLANNPNSKQTQPVTHGDLGYT